VRGDSAPCLAAVACERLHIASGDVSNRLPGTFGFAADTPDQSATCLDLPRATAGCTSQDASPALHSTAQHIIFSPENVLSWEPLRYIRTLTLPRCRTIPKARCSVITAPLLQARHLARLCSRIEAGVIHEISRHEPVLELFQIKMER
jgi:hypothetical protein